MGDTTHVSDSDHSYPRATGPHRLHRFLARAGVLLLIALGLVVVGGGAASAHTATIAADCDNLTVRLTDYKAYPGPNRVKVVIDGTTAVDATFGAGYSRVFPVGTRTTAHSWSVTVTAFDDPDGTQGFSFTRSDTTTPCTPPPPPDACPYLPGTQPPGTPCTPPPDDHETRELRDNPDCTAHTVTVIEQARSRSYTWTGTWTPRPWSAWTTTGTRTEQTTPQDCPSTEVTAAVPQYTPPSCTTGSTLTHAAGVGYTWQVTGPPEARILTAVAAAGYVLVGQTVFGPFDTTSPPLSCVTPSAQVSPQVCIPDQPGGVAAGAIAVGTEPGIGYVVRDSGGAVVADASALPAGSYTVTASAAPGYQLLDGNGFSGGVLTLTILPPGTDCGIEAPVEPAVTAVDECYTVEDRVDFVAANAYWTAEETDPTHVTFTAEDGYYFLDDAGTNVKQLVLEHAALTDEQCPLVPGDVGATCVGNVPYLAYALSLPEGFETSDPTPLTITFENPDGADYVVSGLALSGEMLWPGASATAPLMWPGWDLVNGQYVDVGDKRFGWTRNGITVSFDVNPHYETSLTYPPASVACANPVQTNPPGPGEPPTNPPTNPPKNPPTTPPQVFRPPPALPNTGGPSGMLAGIGALLLVSGCALVRREIRRG